MDFFFMHHRFLAVACGGVLLGFLIPVHFPPWNSWHSEAATFTAGLFLAWQAVMPKIWSDPAHRFSLPFLALPLTFLWIIAALQWGFGIIPFGGELLTIFFYTYFCTICLAFGYVEFSIYGNSIAKEKQSKLLVVVAWCVLAAAGCSVFIAICQAFNLWESSAWIARMEDMRRPGGNMGQPNHLATLLIMGMASAAYLRERAQWSASTTVSIALFLGAGLATTESRTGLLSLLILLTWWLWKQALVAPQASRWGAMGITAAVMAMFLLWPTFFNAIHIMGDSAIKNRLSSMNDSRFQIWPQLGEAVLQKPWLGWGIHQTAQAHNAVAHRYGASAPFTFGHNLVLDLALWVGLPLTGLFVVCAAVWTLRRTKATRDMTSWYGLAIALPVAVHSMLEYPFAYAYFLAPVMLGLGAAEGALGGGTWMRLRLKTALSILLVTTVLMAWSAVEYLNAEEDYRLARFEMLRLGETPTTYDPPKFVLLTQLGSLLDSIRLPLKSNMTASDMDLLRAVVLRYPWATTEYRYAMALALNNKPAEAARQLQVLRFQHGERIYLNYCHQMRHNLINSNIEWQPECELLQSE